MDDILVFSKNQQQHEKHVSRILTKLREHKLSLKPEKCWFNKKEIEFLGLIISENSIKMDKGKVKAILEWPTPTCKREIQQFLGFVNFYRRFVEGFAKIAKALTKLTGKEEWEWGVEQELAFEGLKNQIALEVTLAIPNNEGQYRIEIDASDFTMGGILSQQQPDGTWRPVAFISKSLNEAERNYEIYDKEMLAMMYAFYEWSHYLKGVKIPTEVLTDHQNLTYFRKPQNLNRRQARWVTDLQEYNFEIKHRPGKSNTKADILSRRAGHPHGENDNQETVLLKEELFVRVFNDDRALEEILEKIRKTDKKEWDVIAKQMKSNIAVTENNDWETKEGLNLYKGRVYVPMIQTIRDELIEIHHSWGHSGIIKTLELITRNYWWPHMKKDIEKCIKSCHTCQTTKPDRRKRAAPLQLNEIPGEPWRIISVDLMGPLPESKGNDMIMVVVDRFTKKSYFLPTHQKVTAQGIATLFRDNVWRDHGIPEKVISDRGTMFISKFMKELCEILGIKQNASMAYHPQTDGQTERVNQEVKEFLTMFVNYKQDNWSDWLSVAQFCHNDRQHSATGHSPFFLNYGYHPRKGLEPPREYKVEAVGEFIKRIDQARKTAKEALEKAASIMKQQYDKHIS